jgi:hypothetical protein
VGLERGELIMPLLTPDEIKKQNIANMASMFARMDTTLAGFPINAAITAAPAYQAAAWSDGKTLTLNMSVIKDPTDIDTLIGLNGVNYHELSHILYTPSAALWFRQQVVAEGLHSAWNILEDQRIESLLSSRYLSVAPYFARMFMEYVIQDQRTLPFAFPFSHGRRYLDREIRTALEQAYCNPQNVAEIKSIIDKFRKMIFPRDDKKALVLVRRFSELLTQESKNIDPNGHGQDGKGHSGDGRPEEKGQRNQSEERQERAQKSMNAEDAARNREEKKQDRAKAKEKYQEGQEDAGEGPEGQDGDNDGQGQSSSGGGEDQQSSGGGHGAGNSKVDPKVFRTLQDALDAMKQDMAVARDAREMQRSIVEGGRPLLMSQKVERVLVDVPPQWMLARNRMTTEFDRIVADLDPGFEKFQDSGRLNIQRAMHGLDIDTVFDQWREGKVDASDIEATIGLDVSASTNSIVEASSLAMWAIKSAIESLNPHRVVPAFVFSSATYATQDVSERADRSKARIYQAGGGTNPRGFYEDSKRVMHYAKSKKRVVFCVTDGSWLSNTQNSENLIEDLNDNGVLTVVVYINTDYQPSLLDQYWKLYKHGASVFGVVKDPFDLIQVAKDVVKEMIKQ